MRDPAAAARYLIGEAIDQQATHLDLGGLDLDALPETIGEAGSLTHLSIRDNRLQTLPDIIGQLANLVQLSAANNRLTHLPETLGNCRQLTHLNLRNNRLERLPQGVLSLEKLESLQLNGNQIPLDELILSRWNRPAEVIAAYRLKFPPPKPPPPPSFLIDQMNRYFRPETIAELAELLAVPHEILNGATDQDLITRFIAYHVRHGLETELRDLLQIWVPHVDWFHPQFELDAVDSGHISDSDR